MQQLEREPVQHGTPAYPVGVYQNRRDISWKMILHTHWHSEMEFLFVERGSALFRADAAQCVLQAGNMALFAPGVIHNAFRVNNALCLYTSVVFDPGYVFSLRDDTAQALIRELMSACAGGALYFRQNAQEQAALGAIFRDIRAAHFGHAPGRELLVKSRLLELIYLALSNLRQASKAAQPADLCALSHIKESLLFIHEHYATALSVAELAERAGFSTGYFERTFKRTVGVSPIAYLVGYRIQAASDLLRATRKSVSEIAEEVGFHDFSYFGKCFRQHMQMSPREYRGAQQGGSAGRE